jgi:hypothetical protein
MTEEEKQKIYDDVLWGLVEETMTKEEAIAAYMRAGDTYEEAEWGYCNVMGGFVIKAKYNLL